MQKGSLSASHSCRQTNALQNSSLSHVPHEPPQASSPGCGLSDWEILAAKLYDPELTPQQVGDIQYDLFCHRVGSVVRLNSLFISYCHKDAVFADAIGDHLDKKGVRYWRDIQDAVAGKLERQIDRSMRLNPTVVLVLSEHSVRSDWVEWEADKGRQLEKELGRDVLCPVALDDSWKTCDWPGPLRKQIMKYNILDFSNWRDPASFDRQFKKLLDGLALFYKPDLKRNHG